MTLSKTYAISLTGLHGLLIEVEVDISSGLPTYTLLGLPDSALHESRDRIRSAISNSGFKWPQQKVTVSLAPAWLPKSGSSFDLSIAIGILHASNQVEIRRDHSKILMLGELALDGSVKEIRGALPMIMAAHKSGFESVVIPKANYAEAALFSEINLISVENLNECARWLNRSWEQEPQREQIVTADEKLYDFSEVIGQAKAKAAIEIAAVGNHHMMMIGPPGTGKTMLAERIPTILPTLSHQQSLEVAALYSLGGKVRQGALDQPPFIAPHHSTSIPGIVGGGSQVIRPGAISLAHHGVLFIDEAPECSQGVLDSLRQPMESGEISLTRAIGVLSFPARFLLILAANPCPCGRLIGRGRNCDCSSLQIRRYRNRLTGPILDRIDIRVLVDTPTRVDLSENREGDSSEVMRNRITAARLRSRERFISHDFMLNSQIPSKLLRSKFSATKKAMALLYRAMDSDRLSARGFHKTLRVAWSIADLNQSDRPDENDVAYALELRENHE